jgi:hypothetical protein
MPLKASLARYTSLPDQSHQNIKVRHTITLQIPVAYILGTSISLPRRPQLRRRRQFNKKYISRNPRPPKRRSPPTTIRQRRHNHDSLARQQ